jgi:hypothetical protein
MSGARCQGPETGTESETGTGVRDRGQGQGSDHTGQCTGTRIQDQRMQWGQGQTRQRTGTEGYRTGYNAVHRQMHRPGCRQQTDEQDQIQMTGP